MPTAPHSIRGDDAMAVQGGAKAPDPEARHHDHSAEVRHITSEEDNGDTPLFIEWVYVLSPRQLTVLKSAPTAEHYELTVRGETVQRRRYGWELLVSLSLDGPEPDWQAMEKQGYDLVERRHQEVGS